MDELDKVPVLAAGFIEVTEDTGDKSAIDATKIAVVRVVDGLTMISLVGAESGDAIIVDESRAAVLRAIEAARNNVARMALEPRTR